MRKHLIVIVPLVAVFFVVGLSLAVGPGKRVVFENKEAGRVVMDGKSHAEAGLKCGACHPKIHRMKPPFEKITMALLNAGKSCAVAGCHDDRAAFGVKDCAKCHQR